jgi:thiol-disulfide isomerase/thioredoxin
VTIVKFVAKYCAPCQHSLPALERLHHEHPELVVVAVAEDESEDDAIGIVSTHHLTFPVIHDSGHILGGRYRVTDLPVTFVVDRAGVVAWVGGPEKSDGDIRAAALGTP